MGAQNLSTNQKAKIFDLIMKGVYSNLQIYLDNATDLTEEQIKDLTVLFYKVTKHQDPSFSKMAIAYCESNLAGKS
jgi:hypothetical protein